MIEIDKMRLGSGHRMMACGPMLRYGDGKRVYRHCGGVIEESFREAFLTISGFNPKYRISIFSTIDHATSLPQKHNSCLPKLSLKEQIKLNKYIKWGGITNIKSKLYLFY